MRSPSAWATSGPERHAYSGLLDRVRQRQSRCREPWDANQLDIGRTPGRSAGFQHERAGETVFAIRLSFGLRPGGSRLCTQASRPNTSLRAPSQLRKCLTQTLCDPIIQTQRSPCLPCLPCLPRLPHPGAPAPRGERTTLRSAWRVQRATIGHTDHALRAHKKTYAPDSCRYRPLPRASARIGPHATFSLPPRGDSTWQLTASLPARSARRVRHSRRYHHSGRGAAKRLLPCPVGSRARGSLPS